MTLGVPLVSNNSMQQMFLTEKRSDNMLHNQIQPGDTRCKRNLNIYYLDVNFRHLKYNLIWLEIQFEQPPMISNIKFKKIISAAN